MAIFLPKVDSFSAIMNSEFSFEFTAWLTVMIDTVNQVIQQLQNWLNLVEIPNYTDTEIAASGASWPNGVLVYDSVNNVYVGKQSGSLVKFTTTPYP